MTHSVPRTHGRHGSMRDMQHPPVIFLDVDGVLNSAHSIYRSNHAREWEERHSVPVRYRHILQIDPHAMERLNGLVQARPLAFVVSSSTRIPLGETGVREGLSCYGFTGTVVGITPSMGIPYGRGQEIDAWLREHPEVTDFAILDDDSDMEPHMGRLVKTSFSVGLQREHVRRVLKLLEKV